MMSTIKINKCGGEDAEKRLELKEESEKARLSAVKEKRRYKKMDLLAALAVIGVLFVLLFEAVFVFEVYQLDPAVIRSYLPEALGDRFFPVVSAEELVESEPVAVVDPVELETISVEDSVDPEPVESVESTPVSVSVETNEIPVSVESNEVPVEIDEEIPVG